MRQAYDYWQDQPGSFRRDPFGRERTAAYTTPFPTSRIGHASSARRQLLVALFLAGRDKLFLNETTFLPSPRWSPWMAIAQGRGSRRAECRVLLLGRENILRCELTDGYSGVSRSSTRRARVLLCYIVRHCLSVQPILPFCVHKKLYSQSCIQVIESLVLVTDTPEYQLRPSFR